MDVLGREDHQEEEEEDGLRTRSFRNEDYNNRRVFLRSYPLHWGADEEDENKVETTRQVPRKSSGGVRMIKKPMKEILLSILEWGEGRAIVLRRFKHKVTVYVIACYTVGSKSPRGLISARSM